MSIGAFAKTRVEGRKQRKKGTKNKGGEVEGCEGMRRWGGKGKIREGKWKGKGSTDHMTKSCMHIRQCTYTGHAKK